MSSKLKHLPAITNYLENIPKDILVDTNSLVYYFLPLHKIERYCNPFDLDTNIDKAVHIKLFINNLKTMGVKLFYIDKLMEEVEVVFTKFLINEFKKDNISYKEISTETLLKKEPQIQEKAFLMKIEFKNFLESNKIITRLEDRDIDNEKIERTMNKLTKYLGVLKEKLEPADKYLVAISLEKNINTIITDEWGFKNIPGFNILKVIPEKFRSMDHFSTIYNDIDSTKELFENLSVYGKTEIEKPLYEKYIDIKKEIAYIEKTYGNSNFMKEYLSELKLNEDKTSDNLLADINITFKEPYFINDLNIENKSFYEFFKEIKTMIIKDKSFLPTLQKVFKSESFSLYWKSHAPFYSKDFIEDVLFSKIENLVRNSSISEIEYIPEKSLIISNIVNVKNKSVDLVSSMLKYSIKNGLVSESFVINGLSLYLDNDKIDSNTKNYISKILNNVQYNKEISFDNNFLKNEIVKDLKSIFQYKSKYNAPQSVINTILKNLFFIENNCNDINKKHSDINESILDQISLENFSNFELIDKEKNIER